MANISTDCENIRYILIFTVLSGRSKSLCAVARTENNLKPDWPAAGTVLLDLGRINWARRPGL